MTCSVYAPPLDPTQGPALKKGAGHEMKGGACMKGKKNSVQNFVSFFHSFIYLFTYLFI